MTNPVPERVRVTSPRRVGSRQTRTGASEIDAQTQLGELYMSSLLRSQGRLALTVLVALGVLVGGLPLLFTWAPALAEVELLGMPLPWVLLGFAVYPVMFGLGWIYVRASERTERDFTDVVER
jgi:hypothetical protein